MSHPASVSHLGTIFDLGHFSASRHSFEWRSSKGKQLTLHATVRYSAHCYTDENIEVSAGCYSIVDRGKTRVFCSERYDLSKSLNGIVESLFAAPSKSAALTAEDNWTVYRLQLPGWHPQGMRYHVFFRLKDPIKVVGSENEYMFKMSIESAYPRQNPVATRRNLPFGRIVEDIVAKE